MNGKCSLCYGSLALGRAEIKCKEETLDLCWWCEGLVLACINNLKETRDRVLAIQREGTGRDAD